MAIRNLKAFHGNTLPVDSSGNKLPLGSSCQYVTGWQFMAISYLKAVHVNKLPLGRSWQ